MRVRVVTYTPNDHTRQVIYYSCSLHLEAERIEPGAWFVPCSTMLDDLISRRYCAVVNNIKILSRLPLCDPFSVTSLTSTQCSLIAGAIRHSDDHSRIQGQVADNRAWCVKKGGHIHTQDFLVGETRRDRIELEAG